MCFVNNCVINTVQVFQFSLVLNDQVEIGNGKPRFSTWGAIYE